MAEQFSCWKCGLPVDASTPGRLVEVQRSWADDRVWNTEHGERLPREDPRNPQFCVDHPTLTIGPAHRDDPARAGDTTPYCPAGHDNPKTLVSRPHWTYSTHEQTIPTATARQSADRPGRYTVYHFACGRPSESHEAWDKPGWFRQGAEETTA